MTVTPIDGVRYWYSEAVSAFVAPGRPNLPVQTSRDALVPGTYKPNNAAVVGLLPNQPITNAVYPPSGQTTITLSQPLYQDTIFWGQLRASTTATSELRNCIVAGPDPSTLTTITGNFQSFDSATVLRSHITFTDCLISSKPWQVDDLGRPLAAGATRGFSPFSVGLHGGQFTLNRCEVTDVQDCINYTVGNDGSHCLINQSWLHHTYYRNGWTDPGSPPSQDTHSDLFQFNRGKNIEVRFSVLGGYRNQAAYDIAPPGGYNGGDDSFGAAFMCKQEAGYTTYDQIHNVEIHHNWIYGCEYGFNMVYVAARPNLWADCSIHDNIFSTTYPPQFFMISKSNQLTPIVFGNVIEETGAAVNARNSNYSE